MPPVSAVKVGIQSACKEELYKLWGGGGRGLGWLLLLCLNIFKNYICQLMGKMRENVQHLINLSQRKAFQTLPGSHLFVRALEPSLKVSTSASGNCTAKVSSHTNRSTCSCAQRVRHELCVPVTEPLWVRPPHAQCGRAFAHVVPSTWNTPFLAFWPQFTSAPWYC